MDRLRALASKAALDATEALELHRDTNKMIKDLHSALVVPQPGHSESLLHRMASVTIAAETGKAAGDRVIRWAKIITAVGAIASGLYAALRFGQMPPPK
jgi:hypothetical protein